MSSESQNLNLIDLISERHVLLRNLNSQWWNESHDLHISNSEWFIMARIYKKQPTIAYVTKLVDISRQATHKLIKNLESKGLVEISKVQHNNKDKCIRLTKLGEECFEKREVIKATLEAKIIETIGVEQATQLKKILQSDWGL
ncbi:MarR family winged helix-turn-helix transcriptional regulator [Paenibacillus woosongensis]|uniref:MarR family winged helix-turn-helix transcriptional regulator n=1 Tax=Paenibacillus woosongensis TaxID=307580 RepID=A0AA95I9K9_9BACL|nr:MarR family winged helix-turn-helix transcriptional regulator [Paenibacillus woosongensis]WHX49037.1 MarR family winged helix-turn-helix transcriptional regulator [Paenibacillus woosongensis]